MGTPTTKRFQVERLWLGENLFEFPTWYENMDEVENMIKLNDKRNSWRIFDRWTGTLEYRWAKQTSYRVRERYGII